MYFISKFLKKINKTTNYYNSKDYHYNSIFDNYINPKYISDVIFGINSLNSVDTNEIIKFRGIVEFGTLEKNVEKLVGKPIFYFRNQKLKNHSIFFYKLQIGDFKINVEFHFYRKIFLMGVHSFCNTRAEWGKDKIEKIIFEKYGINKTESTIDKLSIVDKHRNSITINDELSYSITYLSGDSSLLDSFHRDIQHTNSAPRKNEERIEKHLRNNL